MYARGNRPYHNGREREAAGWARWSRTMNARCSRWAALLLGLFVPLALFTFFPPVPAAPTPPPPGGTLTGRFVLDGQAPDRKPLVKKGDNKVRDPGCCAREDIPDESLVVDAKT